MQERRDLKSASTENTMLEKLVNITPPMQGKTRYANSSHHARIRIVAGVDHLLDSDLLGASVDDLLRHHDGQNAVLEASLDVVLVDGSRELEGAVELADRALAHPVAVLLVVVLADLLVAGLDHLGTLLLLLFVVRGRGLLGGVLGSAGVVFALDAALDHESFVVGEFNVNVLLGDAGKFAVQKVGVVGLANIKAGCKRAHRGSLASGRPVDIVVVQKAEERGEVARSVEGVEERHFDCEVLRK